MQQEKNKYILFTPVGMTDPIDTPRDGSILHICRKYKPYIIYLYMSKEICDIAKHDDRFKKSIELLGHQLQTEFEINEILRPYLSDVHLFDFYYDFETEPSNLCIMYPEHKIILNTSSGTPAMKSALYILQDCNIDVFKYNSESERNMLEYILWLQVKEEKGVFLDFIRGITPYLYGLCESLSSKVAVINIWMYCTANGKLSEKKLNADKTRKEILSIIKSYKNNNSNNYLASSALISILYRYIKDHQILTLINELRAVEKNARNIAAYEIVCIYDNLIVSKANMNSADILIKIKNLSYYAYYNIDNSFWDSYLKNKMI